MTSGLAPERDLLRRCRAGDDRAYAELVAAHGRRLFTLASRLVGSRAGAEALVEATFLQAFRSIERNEEQGALSVWLAGLCVRQARRRAGSGAVRRLHPLSPGRIPHDSDGAPGLADALAALPFEERAAVVLRFVLGLTVADAVVAQDVPHAAFVASLARGLDRLRASAESRAGAVPIPHAACALPARGGGRPGRSRILVGRDEP